MDAALKAVLTELISIWENEVVEFKEATDTFDTDKIGRYFSALSNEANLRGKERAWLVFGVRNSTRTIVGTDYRVQPDRLQSLKQQITADTEPSVTFRNIHELHDPSGRVVMMEVPAAPRGLPIAWKGHYHARAGESLAPMGLDKQDEIRNQTLSGDWSAQVVETATTDHLDPLACQRARAAFSKKHANRFTSEEIASWGLETMLDRAKVTQDGKITRTALLLLGKPESAYLLSPHPAQITWKLEGPERAYEHFGPPFLLKTTELFRKIRNIQLRLLPEDELLPYEVSKYDQVVVLEALHNCIAHQDYSRSGRVVVTEYPAKLTFENEGTFFEGGPDDYVAGTKTPRRYRNPFLTQAMTELNMIDTMGYGIHRMFDEQRKRYFPLPDYALSDNGVCLTIHGGVVDPAYTRRLMENSGLQLQDVLALDRVQKKLPIPDDAVIRLRRAKLIEGRRPNLHVSATVADATSQKAQYIKTRPFDDHHYEEMVVNFLRKFGRASRKDIDDLLWNKLSDALDANQKRNKIGNLLSHLRRSGRMRNAGSRALPDWRLMD
ncbi:putative DNA binding domain-containing protein [Mesorhizobium sp. ESP6-5]|uniref:RNA-binding domain-containing protein n=1 Tax=Mesorhizobium sp. ESP6-5 TaxID=2876623 RepID=UPI001CC95C92|nr:RNA-binding domain-containing protein [Mesorhizobium sp. ESP6-5]MBZ9755264.1 putative DNA binding domain-containing protein [Mesorhizobium sp. ESP6-5]